VNPRGKRVAALTAAAFGWGSSATFTKYALGSWPPLTLLTAELAAANVVLWAAALSRGYRRPAALVKLAAAGALEPGLCYALVTIGLLHTTAANAAIITGLESFFVVLLAAVFLRERITPRSAAGLAVAVAGIVIIAGGGVSASIGLGDILVLGGILAAAAYVIVARTTAASVDPLTMTAHQFAAGLAGVLPFAAVRWCTGGETLIQSRPLLTWGAALLVGVFGYAASFLLYNYAIAATPAGLSSIILNLIPVFGVLAAVLVLGERITLAEVIGAVCIVASIAIFPGEDEPAGDEAPPGPADATRPGTAGLPHAGG